MRPDFIVIGAMKCGTSTVCAYLEDHPNAFIVPNCDPNFFSDDQNFGRGPEWYEAFFAGWNGERVCGEGSNDYAWGSRYPEAANRMFAYRPDLKLIFMVRHPIDRIASAWVQIRSDSGDVAPSELDRCVIDQPDVFLGQSLYWKNISLYRNWFPDSQIFVGFLEELTQDGETFFKKLAAFLGIEPLRAVKRSHVNPSSGKLVPMRLYSALNNLSITPMMKKVLPSEVKKAIRYRLLSRYITAKPEFSEKARRYVAGLVRDDAEKFLEYAGKPRDFWSFE